jgi:hypothetical protein
MMMSNAISASAYVPYTSSPAELAQDVSMIQRLFPRIGEKIISMWGSVALNSYLSSLIFDERGGRQGFPEQIAAALFRLLKGHEALIHSEKKNGDIWDVILDQVK